MKRLLTIWTICTLTLIGCATPNEADFKNAEPECAQKCHANFSNCLSAFTIFPIQQNNQCVAGLQACAQSCPVKGSTPLKTDENSTAMGQAKSKCLDLGFKPNTDAFGQCILKLSK